MFIGEIISLFVALSWTVTALFAEVASKRMGSLPLNVVRMVMSLSLLAVTLWLVMGIPWPRFADGPTWLWLLLSGVVGYVIGDYCLMQGYIYIGSRFGQLFMTLSAPTAAIMGRLLIGEEMSPLAIVGMCVTLTGIENGTFRYNEEPYPVPVLDFGKKSDYSETEQAKDGSDITYVNKYVIDHAKDGKRVLFGNCGHMDFTDLPLFSPLLASMLGSEKIDHEAFLNRMNGLVLNWFDFYLKGNGTLDIQAEY